MNKYTVTLWPGLEKYTLSNEIPLMQALKREGVALRSSCGGHATCADCTIVIRGGEEHLSPQNFQELKLLGNVYHITKERLACQLKPTGDITIDINEHLKTDMKRTIALTSPKAVMAEKKKPILKKKEDLKVEVEEIEQPAPDSDKADPKRKKGPQGGGRRPKAFHYSDSGEEDDSN